MMKSMSGRVQMFHVDRANSRNEMATGTLCLAAWSSILSTCPSSEQYLAAAAGGGGGRRRRGV